MRISTLKRTYPGNNYIVYIKGELNTVADAFSQLLPVELRQILDYHDIWPNPSLSTVLSLAMDVVGLMDILASYLLDTFCTKLVNLETTGVKNIDGLWYIGLHLVIPWYKDIWENLFCMSHNCLGHFRTDKSYAVLHNSYYWPNM